MDIAARLAAMSDAPSVSEVDELLREFALLHVAGIAGSPQDAELIDALLEIRSLASSVANQPCAPQTDG